MSATSNTKKKFVLLYVITILVICAAASAFIIVPRTKTPVTNNNIITPQIKTSVTNKSIIPPLNNALLILNQLNIKWTKLNADHDMLITAQGGGNSTGVNKIQQQLLADKQLMKQYADSLLQAIPSESSHLFNLVNHYKQLVNLPFQPEIQVINSDVKDNDFARQLKFKNDKIIKLKQRLQSNVSNSYKPLSSQTKDEVKFLKWALSSQSAEVRKLKTENTLLKSKLK